MGGVSGANGEVFDLTSNQDILISSAQVGLRNGKTADEIRFTTANSLVSASGKNDVTKMYAEAIIEGSANGEAKESYDKYRDAKEELDNLKNLKPEVL